MEEKYLVAACRRLEVSAEQVLSWRVYPETAVEAGYIALVVDKGVAGCPKYKIPLAELEVPQIEVAEPEPDLKEPEATIAAVRLAEKHGVRLSAIDGSGKGGKITLRDVKEAINNG